MARVMLVDDESGILNSLSMFLEREGHEVYLAEDVDSAIIVLASSDLDVIVCDYILPRKTGMELLRCVREEYPDVQVIMNSGEPTIKNTVQAMRLGAFDFLEKPVSAKEVCKVIKLAATKKEEIDRAKRALRSSEEQYRQVFETAIDGIIIVQDEVLKLVNSAFTSFIGAPSEHVIGKSFTSFLAPEEIPDMLELYARYAAGEGDLGIVQTKVINILGETRNVEINGGRISFEDRSAVLLIIRDITEHREAEAALRESEAKFRALSEATVEGIVIHEEGKNIHVNKAMKKMFGYTEEELIGNNLLEHMLTPASLDLAKNMMLNQSSEFYEVEAIRKDGTHFPATARGMRLDCLNQAVRVAAIRDISHFKEAEEKLIHYQEQLRSLAAELVVAEENERRRIATLLHDGIGQVLASVNLQLKLIHETITRNEPRISLEEVIELIEKTIEDTRSLTFDLSPPIIFESKLSDSLKWLLHRYAEKLNIPGSFEDDDILLDIDEPVRILLFHVYRELLVNVSKHAEAKTLKGSFYHSEGKLIITLEDDGIGFNVNKTETNNFEFSGYGLFSIRERIRHLDGNMELESEPGGGTRIALSIPLKQQ